MIDYTLLMAKAEMLRKKLGEDSHSPIDVFTLAQNIDDLSLVFYPMGEKLSGMCIKGKTPNRIIAINSTMTMGRQRFSLAHEFYHLFFDDTMLSVCGRKINTGKEIEKSADYFASCFLIPNVALMEYVENLSDKNKGKPLSLIDVIQIEQYFQVSHQATIFRLINTKVLNEEQGKKLLDEHVKRHAELLGYSSDLYKPLPEEKRYITYGNYINKAKMLLEKELISEGKYEELLLDAFRADLVFGIEDEDGEVLD